MIYTIIKIISCLLVICGLGVIGTYYYFDYTLYRSLPDDGKPVGIAYKFPKPTSIGGEIYIPWCHSLHKQLTDALKE